MTGFDINVGKTSLSGRAQVEHPEMPSVRADHVFLAVDGRFNVVIGDRFDIGIELTLTYIFAIVVVP